MALEIPKPYTSKLKIGDFFYVPFRKTSESELIDTLKIKNTFQEEYYIHCKLNYLVNQPVLPEGLRMSTLTYLNFLHNSMVENCPTWDDYCEVISKQKELTKKLDNVLRNVIDISTFIESEKRSEPVNLSVTVEEQVPEAGAPVSIFDFNDEDMTI